MLCPATVRSYSTPNVPVDDPVYRDIDKLVAAGLVKDVIYGQRPWSRGEIARIIASAMQNREKMGPPVAPDDREITLLMSIDTLLEKMKKRFQEELAGKTFSIHPLSYVEAQYTFLDGESRPIPNNGFGSVNAVIEPLTAYQEGRHYPDGHQWSLETEHSLRATRYFSFYVRPRLEFDVTHGGDADADLFVQQLYAKFAVPHFELEVGRDSIEWGQGEQGGILLSNNARPLDMIKISNPSPTILPWLFKYLGPFRYTFFVANLGPEREFPHSFLTGLKLSIKPVSFFEMGFSQLMVFGGDGAPGPLSVGNVVGEFFGRRGGGVDIINLTNRETGFDFRFFLPMLRNAQVYLDVQFEDDSSDRIFMLTELATYHAGIYLPRLGDSGDTSLRLEYRHGSPYFYKHSQFVTGMALNGRLLGDELGPHADGAYVTFSHEPSENLWLSYSFRFERRDGDFVTEVKDPKRRVVTVTPQPAESRIGLSVKGIYNFKKPIALTLEFGYERIDSFNFSADDRNAFLGSVSVRYHLF